MKTQKKVSVLTIAQIAIFTAVISILAQIQLPLPGGVPITLHTFGIALTGFVLGAKCATASTVVYVLLGTVGVPVFSGFTGGPSSLVSPSGGFFWGFIIMAFLCGLGMNYKNKIVSNLLGIIGLLLCHLVGVVHFSVITHTGIIASLSAASAPFVLKDMISVVVAYVFALQIRKALYASNLLERKDA